MNALLTVGHGTLAAEDLAALLRSAGVRLVVDVRRFPGSRRHPDLARDALAAALPAAGIAYRWEPRLGGRRHLTKDADAASPDRWWRVAAFRAYAGYTRTEEFDAALRDVLADVLGGARGAGGGAPGSVAVMCSESVWWRCHRRLLADHLVIVEDVPVVHLMHDGREVPHPITEGARRDDEGVIYDAVAPDPSS